jgi:N-methylhydantoinase B
MAELDPVTFEVLRNAFRAICNESSALLARLAYAGTIAEGHDFSGSLLTVEGRLIAHGQRDQAAHLGTFEESIRTTVADADGIHEGDIFIFNDPYTGGTHQPDIKIIRPIFVQGRHVAFGISCGHWPDVGGVMPGTFNPRATECYAEGLRIPPTLLYSKGQAVRSTFNLLRANVRVPEERMGDLHAQVQATALMETRLREYVDRFGLAAIEQAIESLMDRSESLIRRRIGTLPDGEFEFVDFSDRDIMHPEQPRIRVHLRMRIEGDQVTFDFTGSDAAPISPFGFARPALLSAVYDGTMHCFPDLIPLNHGITRSIEVVSRPGSCVDVVEPTPVTGFASGAYEKVAACVMACWAQAFAGSDPRQMHAATVNLANLALSGRHPDSGRPFVSYLWNEGGQGARSYKDGNSFQLMIFIGGATNQPIEVIERLNPIRYTKCEARIDSCGHGKFRGGFGIDRSFEATGDMVLTMHGDRAEVTPFGLAGGRNGGANLLVQDPGEPGEANLGMHAAGERVKAGERFLYCSNGGGGFGRPIERDVAAVAADVADGFISVETARMVYGVEFRVDGSIDAEATAAMRRQLAGQPDPTGYGPGEVHPMGARVLPRLAAEAAST